MRKRREILTERTFTAATRSRREPWRSLAIVIIKLIFYGVQGAALFCLVLFPDLIHTLFTMPVLRTLVTVLFSLTSCYLFYKAWLAILEYRLEDQITRAKGAPRPQPIALTSHSRLLFPWWTEQQLNPFTVIIERPAAISEQQAPAVTRRLASSIAAIRLQLFSAFRLTLVGADGTQVILTLERREPRYVALLALLAISNDGEGIFLSVILDTLYQSMGRPRGSFDGDKDRLLHYLNKAALRGGLSPLPELFVHGKSGVEQKVCYTLIPLCEVEFVEQFSEWEAQIRRQLDLAEPQQEEVRRLCQQVIQGYDRGLLTAHWEMSPFDVERDPVWWWIKQPFQAYRARVVALLLDAAQMEMAVADRQLAEERTATLTQAAHYYEQVIVILLTGIPDKKQARELLTRGLELCQHIPDECLGESLQHTYQSHIN